mmetsp:Transcript_4277/g.11158  ORF Transcript_4277/g.11158 Transcript_4277/m.11158 type:complete len:237 (-) Transcript_4277:229-939(-)
MIAGSSGRLPGLLVQLIAARGARACVAAQQVDCEYLHSLGAAEAIDHNRVSFSSAFGSRKSQPLDAVLDCVGAEPMADAIHSTLGAAYVSLASPSLQRLEEDGAASVLRDQWRRWRNGATDDEAGATAWRADSSAARALEEVLGMIDSGELLPPPEANAVMETAEQFAEYVSWSRDTESGGRYGFPGDSIWIEASEEKNAKSKPQRLWTTLGGDAANLAFIDTPRIRLDADEDVEN